MSDGRCPKCSDPFDDHALPTVATTKPGLILKTAVCRPAKDRK